MAEAVRYRPPVTVEELDILEHETQVRHELVDGIAYAMVGGSADHGAIVNGIVMAFGRRLSLPCQVFSESTRLMIRGKLADDYLYPDVMISCDPADRAKGHRERPVLLAEVLSPSSMVTDRDTKFARYRGVPSLEYYLLVAQDRVAVEVFSRAGGWRNRRLGPKDTLDLPALSLSLPVREFYAQVDP